VAGTERAGCSGVEVDYTHSSSGEGRHSAVAVLEKGVALLPQRTSDLPWELERSWSVTFLVVSGRFVNPYSEISLVAALPRICLRRPHLFGKRKHGHNCSVAYSADLAGPRSLPFLSMHCK